MASAFWTLEDGRGFARRWSWVNYMLELIVVEMKEIKEAKDFYKYLRRFLYKEEEGDEYNGYGGFYRDGEEVMFNFDLRSFTPKNREYFWKATQMALTKLKSKNDVNKDLVELLFITLLDMDKRIKKGENPMELNDLRIIEPDSKEKLGPGWN